MLKRDHLSFVLSGCAPFVGLSKSAASPAEKTNAVFNGGRKIDLRKGQAPFNNCAKLTISCAVVTMCAYYKPRRWYRSRGAYLHVCKTSAGSGKNREKVVTERKSYQCWSFFRRDIRARICSWIKNASISRHVRWTPEWKYRGPLLFCPYRAYTCVSSFVPFKSSAEGALRLILSLNQDSHARSRLLQKAWWKRFTLLVAKPHSPPSELTLFRFRKLSLKSP